MTGASLLECRRVPDTLSLGTYQAYARKEFEDHADVDLQPWSWVLTTCGNWCLNPEHMFTQTPTKIAYAPGVCIYCGNPAGTRDHLLPRTMTGTARRQFVAVVPACGWCNSTIGSLPEFNVTTRREHVKKRLRVKKRKVLDSVEWTDKELREFGPHLRRAIDGYRAEKQLTLARLAWPEGDLFYDLAAFQRSGIEDPVTLGLIDNPFTPKETTP